MNKAEDKAAKKALEKFPILFSERMGYDKTNLQQERRNAYEKGYQQAEKDLELTYDDICEIMEIREDVLEMDSYENLYEEILKRFKERKDGSKR